jgi:hypothetical protein
MRLLLSTPERTIRGMELLIAAVLVALLGVLAQAAGSDSRDADTRSTQLSW